MAQGPPLLPAAVSPVAVTPPHGRPCHSAPTCRGFTSCHSTDATNTNTSPPEPYQREAPPGFAALLRPVRDGVPSQAEGVGDRFPCESVPPAETHVGSGSPPDVCHRNTGSSILKIFVAATTAAGREAGGRQDASAEAAEASADEPTDQHVVRDKRQHDARSPAGSTRTTSARLGRTQPVQVATQCVYTGGAAAVEPAVRVGDTSPTGTPLFSARNSLVYSPECTVFPAESSTGSGATPSAAAVASSKCTAAKFTATIQVTKPAGAVACTGNKSATAVDVTVALGTDRGPAANAAAKTAIAEPKLPEAGAADLSGVDAAAGATVAASLEPASHGTDTSTLAAVATPITAASKCAAAGTAADTAHHGAPVQRDGEGCWWRTSASRHLRKGKSYSFCHGSVDSAEISNRSSCRNAKHDEKSGGGIRVNNNSAECSTCPTINMRGITFGQGDTTDTSTSHANVERPRLPLVVEDPTTLPESSARPDKSSNIFSLSNCGGKGLPPGKQKSFGRKQGGTNSNELRSNGNGKGDICHENSVNGSTDRLINDSCDPISSYQCNSSVDGSSKCHTYGGNTTVGNSVFPFTSLVDSCRSTTVSTPSPAASSTSRSVRSCSLQMDGIYCLISSCDSCDFCDVRSSSSDSGTTGEGSGPIENDTSLLEWHEVSPVALLGCSCCCTCTPSPPLGCSTGVLAGEEPAASCCAPVCRFNGDRRVLGSCGVPRTTETTIPDTPARRATTLGATREEEHQHVYVTNNDVQLHPKPLPVEELLLPAAVVLSRDVLFRAQQQRQLPWSPPALQASHATDDGLRQADAAVTPAAAACRKGNGVWCCSSSNSWSSPSSSTSSPSVFSQLPIVPLSAWPVPATYVGEDGVFRPQTAMKSTSRDNVECNDCSRGAELICYSCSSGDCKSQEIVVHPAGRENRRKDSLHSGRHIAQGNCRPHLGRRRHKQSLASVSSGATNQSLSELVLPALFKRPTHHDRDAIQVKSEAPAAAAENVPTLPVDAEDASASNQMEILPASRSPSLLQLPLLFPAECWVMSQVARGTGAVAPSAPMQDASRADAGFCCSTLRTATLLLGDHDSESTTTGDWSVCNSSSLLVQHHREETYQRKSCTTGDSGRNNAYFRPSNSCGSTVGVKESCNSSSSGGRAGLSQSCALQGREQRVSLKGEQAPSCFVPTAQLNNLPSRQCCTNDRMPGPQSKDWLPARGEPQRQQESGQRDATQEQAESEGLQLQAADDRYGQRVRQAGDARGADAAKSIGNAQADTSVEGASVTAALDKRRAHGSETTIDATPLQRVPATKDTSAAAEQPSRAETCKFDQGLQPGGAELSETAAVAADSLITLKKALRVESNRPIAEKVHDLNQCDSNLLDSVHTQKAAGTVTETPGSTVAAPGAISAVRSDAAAAGRPFFEASVVLDAARPKCGDDDTNSSLADSSILNGASFRSNEASKPDAATGIGQERRAAAVAGKAEEHMQLLQDCVVATADTRVPATPPAPRRHRRNKPEDVYTSSETRHRSTAQAESRRWSRSSSRGSVSSTSTQSGLPSHWTSRSSSTRCSPLSSSKDEPLASAATAADVVEETPAASDRCLSAADLLHPIPSCTSISLPHTELHQVMSTSNPQSSSPRVSFVPVSVATASVAAVGGSSVPKVGRAVEFAECPAETASVAAVTSMFHPERVPPTILAAARHAAAAPVSAGAAVVGSLALDGFLPATPPQKLAASQAALDSADSAAVSENNFALQPVQPLEWPSRLLGTGGAPPRAPDACLNSSVTPGPPVRGTPFGASLATKAFSKRSRSPKVVAAVAFSGLAEAASVRGGCASQSANPAAVDPADVLSCDTASSQQHSVAAPILLVSDAKPDSGEKNPSPAAVKATQIPCLSASSANAGTLLTTRLEGAGAEVVEHRCVKQGKPPVLRQTRWSGQQIFEKERVETQESPHVAAELATLSRTQPSRSVAHINHHDPVHFESQHLQPALKELPTRQRLDRGIRGEQSVQQLRQHPAQQQETEKPPHLHKHHHPCRVQRPQEVVTHVGEGVYHRRSSNTPLAPVDYPLPCTGSPVGQKVSTKELRHQGSSGVNENSNNNPKSHGGLNPVVAVNALPTAAADAAFFSCNAPDCANALRCSSAWVSATGATAASSAGEGDTAVVTRNGGNWDSRFVEDTNCTLSGGCEASDTSACRTFHTSAAKAAAASLSSSATPPATPAGSVREVSCWKLPHQHVCSTECICASSSGGFVIDTTVLTDSALLPGPLLERGGEKQVPQQLQHGLLPSTCPSSRIRQTTGSSRASQDLRAEPLLGSIQTPETATATSREWVPVTAHTQREPAGQQAAAATTAVPAKTEGEQYIEEAESHRQTGHGRWVTQQQNEVPDPGPSLYSETAAGGKPLLKREIIVSTTVNVAEDGVITSDAARGCASGQDASFARPPYTSAADTSVFHDAAAARLPASTPAVIPAAANTGAVTTGDTKAAADAEMYPAVEDRRDGQEEPEREHLITMSDSRWIALRRSGLFRLGDKGRASIKSRIAKQLRLCPDLRRAAAAIGGGGVRCATTKQLYQLAELCGFDDVLPPEFRRPRSSAVQSGATSVADTPAPATDKTAARFVVAGNVRKCRAEKTSSTSSAVPLVSTKRPAPDEASADDQSSTSTPAVPTGASSGVDNGDLRARYDSISSSGRPFDSSSLSTTAYTAGSGTLQNLSRQQPASALEQQLQQKLTAHCVSDKKSHKLRQHAHRRPSAAATMTQVAELQHNSTAWHPSKMQQLQQQRSHNPQQPPLQHVYQQQQQSIHQYQQQLHHQQQPYTCLEPKQQQCYEQQHQLPVQHEREPTQTLLSMFPHAPRERTKFSEPCGGRAAIENTVPETHTDQQSPPLQTHSRQRHLVEHHMQQRQEPQAHLLQQDSIRSRDEPALQQLHFPEQQQTAQHPEEQERILGGHLHTKANAAVLDALKVTPPRIEATGIETPHASVNHARSTGEFLGASEAHSTTVVAISPHAAVFRLSPASGSTADNRYSTSRNDNNCDGCCNNTDDDSWTRKRSTMNSACWTAGTDSSELFTCDSVAPPKQLCSLQQMPRRNGDKQLQLDQQELPQGRPFGCAPPRVGEWISLEGVPTDVPGNAAASIDKGSAATTNSKVTAGVAPRAARGIAVGGSASGVVTDGRGQGLQQLVSPLVGVSPAETAPAGVAQSHLTQKGSTLPEGQPSAVLSQSAQGSRTASTSPQSWGENGVGTALVCGSSLATSGGDCLAEYAGAKTPAREEIPRRTASSNNAGDAAQCELEGGAAPLQVDATGAVAAATVAAKCRPSPAAGEQVSCNGDAQVRATQEQRPSHARLPKKRRKVESPGTASQHHSSPRALTSNTEKQHPPRSQCFLDEHDVAQQRQQLSDGSGATYPVECCQPRTALAHGSRGGQVGEKVLAPCLQDIRVGEPQQRLQLAAEEEERVHPQYARQRQDTWQHPWKDGSLRLPGCVSQLSCGVEASRYAPSMNEELQSPASKTANGLEAYHQLQQVYGTGQQNFSSVSDSQGQRAYGTSTRRWQEESCSSTSNTRCTTTLCNNNSSIASTTWMSATDTHVVDEFFDVQPTSETGSSSGRSQVQQDTNRLIKGCNRVSS